MLQNIITCFET